MYLAVKIAGNWARDRAGGRDQCSLYPALHYGHYLLQVLWHPMLLSSSLSFSCRSVRLVIFTAQSCRETGSLTVPCNVLSHHSTFQPQSTLALFAMVSVVKVLLAETAGYSLASPQYVLALHCSLLCCANNTSTVCFLSSRRVCWHLLYLSTLPFSLCLWM